MNNNFMKKENKINEIVHNYTIFYGSGDTFTPTLIGLENIINKIINSNETTEFLKITPIYKNYILNKQIEFDEYPLMIKCRDNFSYQELIHHFEKHIGKNYYLMMREEKRWATISYPLCKMGDIKAYHGALGRIKIFLPEYIPVLFEIAKQEMMLKEKDLAFGYFCFKINSK
ncbi:MAG: hypothetical protein ACRC6X_02785 [Culicoidibacterales bacterium]